MPAKKDSGATEAQTVTAEAKDEDTLSVSVDVEVDMDDVVDALVGLAKQAELARDFGSIRQASTAVGDLRALMRVEVEKLKRNVRALDDDGELVDHPAVEALEKVVTRLCAELTSQIHPPVKPAAVQPE